MRYNLIRSKAKKSMLAAIGASKTAQVFGFFFIQEDNQYSLLQSAIFRAHACNFKLVLVLFVYCPRRKLLRHKGPGSYDRVTPEAASLLNEVLLKATGLKALFLVGKIRK